MKVDKSGFDKKMKAMRLLYKSGMPKIVEDAATYLNAKLVGSILNGQSGFEYPKVYPAGVTSGVGGFVGTQTSRLRGSINPVKQGDFIILIKQINAQEAPYLKYVASWTTEKYAMNFYEIAVKLYGPKITLEIFKFLKNAHKDIDSGSQPKYSNPFPG